MHTSRRRITGGRPRARLRYRRRRVKIAGIMSGTSLDGIDVAVVEIRGKRIKPLAFSSTPYPNQVREAILGVSNAMAHTATIARLHYLLGELYADAVLKA